jgi:hypothetical protein
MGIVPMEVVDSVASRGYYYYTRSVYVYCDECGSFNIKKYITWWQWLLIIGSVLFLFAFRGFFPFSLLIGFLVYKLWGFPGYQCRKCGTITTIQYNTRDYPSDHSIVDVPEQSTQKYYMEYWPDECDLSDYLKPPPDHEHSDTSSWSEDSHTRD